MIELIFAIILVGSFLGILAIIFRKIPVLSKFSETKENFSRESFLLNLKEKIKKFFIFNFKSFPLEIILQKILSKIRILTLRLENKISLWLQKLREEAQKKKNEENDNYWKKLKKLIKSKKKLPR